MRINISLPEKLITDSDKYCDEYMMTRSELIKNALVQYIMATPRNYDSIGLKDVLRAKDALDKNNNQEKAPILTREELSVPVPTVPEEYDTEPELKPMCEMPNCRVRSDGHYSILANMERNDKWLCPFHWNKARSENGVEVKEI